MLLGISPTFTIKDEYKIKEEDEAQSKKEAMLAFRISPNCFSSRRPLLKALPFMHGMTVTVGWCEFVWRRLALDRLEGIIVHLALALHYRFVDLSNKEVSDKLLARISLSTEPGFSLNYGFVE